MERSKKIFNLSARLELKCGGEEFQGEEHSAVRRNGAVSPVMKQLQKQKRKKRSKREQLESAAAETHFLPVRPESMGEVCCRRSQCWLHRELRNMTTWPTLQRAECRQTRTKNQHQVRAAGEIPPLEAEVRGTVPDEVCSDTS